MSLKTKEQIQAEYDAAMLELDTLSKSKEEPLDELGALTKALEAEIAGDALKKSGDGDADNEGGPSDGDEDNEDDEKDKDAEPEMEKSIRLAAEAEALRKSQEADEDYEEMVKASEAYSALEGTIQKSHGTIAEQLGALSKGLAAVMDLNVKIASVVASQSAELTAMKKSRVEELDTLQKSMATLGAKPVMPNTAVLGIGTATKATTEEPMTKSVSEINELLLNGYNEGKVDVRYIGIYGTHKTLDCLPEAVRKTIGV